MTFLFYTAIIVFILLCVLLSLVILVQESKSLGLGASFGGDSGESLFGTSTASVLKKFTVYLGVVFVASCVLLSVWTSLRAMPKSRMAPQIEALQSLEN